MRELTLVFESRGGQGDGLGAGEGRGVGDGTCWTEPCSQVGTIEVLPAAVIPPRPPEVRPVRADELAAIRISGHTQIEPSDARKSAMACAGHLAVSADLHVCVSDRGEVTSVDLTSSTGYADYDARLLAGVRGWRYRPYTVDGVGVAVCGAVRFNYRLAVPRRHRCPVTSSGADTKPRM
jgi:TonB family protein